MFQQPIVGTALCFVALQLAVAVDPESTTLPVSVPKNTGSVASASREVKCSIPPAGVDPASCCNLATPFPGTVLSSCQKAHVQWQNGSKNSTCGSQCLFNYLVNSSSVVEDIMSNPPEKLLLQMQNLSMYMNAISNCVKLANFEKFLTNLMSENAAFQNVLCELDLLAVADCMSKDLFMNCQMFTKSEKCQSVKTFLDTPCPYGALFA